MSKIIKKQDITVLIESTLKEAGIDPNVVKKQLTSVNGEEPTDEEMANIKGAIEMDNQKKSNKKSIKKESTSSNKPLINEDFQKEMDRFKKLSHYTFKK